MLFSLQWLRELCPVESSADRIAEALTSRGLTVDATEPRGDDVVLDVDIPANRGDCLGHVGVARELSAAFDLPLAQRPAPIAMDDGPAASVIRVEIDEPALCTRFTATVVRDVRIAPSHAEVTRRLETCGLRSINNVVDASNLVMLETGNPVHFYDLDRLRGGVIRARRAEPGERLTTLDDVEQDLFEQMLLIADGERALGLAGIMGGADSEIAGDTRNVLIEVAWFEPRSIRTTARKLGMKTDANFRFERGVDPEGVLDAQALSVSLLTGMCQGRLDGGLIDTHPAPLGQRELTLRLDQLPRLLGYRPDDDETTQALSALGLSPRTGDVGEVIVTLPSWRSDLGREADLVEEVARHLGYDRIPAHRTEMAVEASHAPGLSISERCRDALSHLGFHEAFGYAMVAEGEDDPFVWPDAQPAIALKNPIAETMGVLRRSLLPGLRKAVELNVRRGVRNVRLFEIEHVFAPVSQDWLRLGHPGLAPHEPAQLGLAWSGNAQPVHWAGPGRQVDLFDMAGAIETVLENLAPDLRLEKGSDALDGFHPGRAICWRSDDGSRIAWCGELHPEYSADIDLPVYLGSVDLAGLEDFAGKVPSFSRLPRLGSVNRDIAVVLPRGSSFLALLTTLEQVDAPVPARFSAVDRYEGAPLAEGESSVTVRVTLQPLERTLTEDEIERFRMALVDSVIASGLKIRG